MSDSTAVAEPPGAEVQVGGPSATAWPGSRALEPYVARLRVRLLVPQGDAATVELRLRRPSLALTLHGRDAASLLAGLREPDGAAASGAAVVADSLALALKVEADLQHFDLRKSASVTDPAAVSRLLAEDDRLLSLVFERLGDVIAAAVPRGELWKARTMRRLTDHLSAVGAALAAAQAVVKEEILLREMRGAHRRAAREASSELARRRTAMQRLRKVVVAATERSKRSGRPALAWVACVAMLATALALGNRQAARARGLPAVSLQEAQGVIGVTQLRAAGAMLHGTLSEDWMERDYTARVAEFERLRQVAVQRGFTAVFVVDSAGHPVARWSRGSLTVVRAEVQTP